jgi:hypothetical protein
VLSSASRWQDALGSRLRPLNLTIKKAKWPLSAMPDYSEVPYGLQEDWEKTYSSPKSFDRLYSESYYRE